MKHRKLLLSVLSLFLVLNVAAQEIFDIPESSDVRSCLVESWFELPVPILRTKAEEKYESINGTTFQVRFEDDVDKSRIIVAPSKIVKYEVHSAAGVEQIQKEEYLEQSPGSWVFFKDTKTGKIDRIVYYFAINTEVYLEFNRSLFVPAEKSLANLIVFGRYAATDVPVGIPLEYFYDMSGDDVLSILRNVAPWASAAVYYPLYEDLLQMTGVIRENLPRFRYVEDDNNADVVAYDDLGMLVSIKDGKPFPIPDSEENLLHVSSIGFVKWIVDGLVLPISGSGIILDKLVENTKVFNEGSLSYTMAQMKDTTTALDWTRNLAAAMVSIYYDKNYDYATSGVQVNSVPFNDVYIENSGFKISKLTPIFYYLAVTEPGRFYLGAIRKTVKLTYDELAKFNVDDKLGGNDGAEIVVYNECAAFFPMFDENGKFSVAVFMDGEEISIDDFMNDYSEDFIQLVRIQSSAKFVGSNESGKVFH